MTAQAGDGRWLAFRTREPLPPDTGVTVVVGAGTPSAEGPLTTTAAQTLGLPHVRPAAGDRGIAAAGRKASARPARRGRSSSATRSTPPPSRRTWCAWSRRCPASSSPSTARCSWSRAVRSRARRTASPSPRRCPTRSARPSARSQTVTFAVGPRGAVASGGGRRAGGPRSRRGPAAVRVFDGAGHAEGHRASRGARGLARVSRSSRSARSGTARCPSPPGTRVVVAHGDRRRDRPTSSWRPSIDLQAALPGGLGHAIVVVEPAGPRRARAERVAGPRHQVGPGHAHRTRRVRGCDAASWPGPPRSTTAGRSRGSRSSSSPAAPARRPDPTAWPRSRWARRRPRCVARQGNDVALLPARTSWWDQTGWQRVEDQDQLRWMVFDDRGLYRPGEEVEGQGVGAPDRARAHRRRGGRAGGGAVGRLRPAGFPGQRSRRRERRPSAPSAAST